MSQTDASTGDHEGPRGAISPADLFDLLRDHPDWDDARREAVFERLVVGFDRATLRAAVRERLRDLGGADAEAILRLAEADGSPELLGALAEAVADQPDLPPERAWEALGLLAGAGLLDEYPQLAERHDEIAELIEDEGPLDELAAQLDDEPDGVWVALHGLAAVEPEVRAEIVAGLIGQPPRPGLVEFLRLLTLGDDPSTQAAALAALESLDQGEPLVVAAWSAIAGHHPDPQIAASAARRAGGGRGDLVPLRGLAIDMPRLRRSVVTALDGRGRGYVVLASSHRGEHAAAAFLCDVREGVCEVVGHAGRDVDEADRFVDEFASHPERDAVVDVPELAVGLLAGSLLLGRREGLLPLPYWIERTLGPGFRPRPFAGRAADETSPPPTAAEAAEQARLVLETCPDWIDHSALTYELAEEIRLREGDLPPDPARDAGAFRYLFEHRLQARLELDRRMLAWMAAFWDASGAPELADAARSLALQLADPQNAVPAHPFISTLARRSLEAARLDLRAGIDPRRAE